MSIFEELDWRGLVYDGSEGVAKYLAENKVTLYIGFDPTAASLHVGSLLQIMALARMQRFGHSPIALVGGGTGLIGDPSGKSQERQLLTVEKVEENCQGLREQLSRFLDFDAAKNPARLINNADWLTTISMVDFLRDVGKHFTVNSMMAKESVSRRMEAEDGLSFTEFSYQLLQSYDFVVLHERHDCTLQMGGSDQWGNITAGTDLVRRMRQGKAYGLVGPLVMTSTGQKFGKTEAGAVWLDAELTSPYRFYQFWLSTSDDDVVRYLKYFTFLTADEIAQLEAAHEAEPQKREGHHRLAREVTTLVHGEDACERAIQSSRVLFGAEISDLAASDLLDIFNDVPSSQVASDKLVGEGMSLVELMIESGLESSKGAARRLIRDGGAYVNNRRITDERHQVRAQELLDGQVLILRKGQKKYHVVTVEGR